MTYATDIFLGDGTTAAFDLTFDYLQRDHVHVYIVASDQPGAARTELTVVDTGTPGPGEYVWSTDIRITVGTAPPVGEYLWIQRETPEDQQIVQWVDGSYIVATDLNTSDKQWLYSIQELHDLIDTINGADAGNALKGITVTAPLESDTTDPQIPILSVDEAVSTDDPNALTSDVQLMSAKAIDLAFSQAVGSTSSYPPGGVTAKVGKLLVDTYGSNPCLYYWTGSAWQKIYAEDADLSTTDDLPEGSVNLYYTDARVEAYVNGAGYIKDLTGFDTDDLAEGSVNLYYTDARVESYVNGAGYIKGPVVTKIIAGANVGISPGSGVGEVTITASGGGGGGGIPEAPLDGTLYGRENATWVAVPDATDAVQSVNGQTGIVSVGVEQLADFAYYPASNEITLVGPSVGDLSAAGVTNSAYKAYLGGSVNDLWVLYLASNTAQNEVFEQLTEGDAMNISYYVNANGSITATQVDCTFKSFEFNTGSDPLQSWLKLEGTFSSFGTALGNYPMVITSPNISNGFKPIATGQALIYDQTTEKWRPEDIATELNISALPALP